MSLGAISDLACCAGPKFEQSQCLRCGETTMELCVACQSLLWDRRCDCMDPEREDRKEDRYDFD